MNPIYPDTTILFYEKGEIHYRINPKYYKEYNTLQDNGIESKKEYYNYFDYLDNRPNVVMIDFIITDLNDNDWYTNGTNMVLDFLNIFNEYIILANKYTDHEYLDKSPINRDILKWYCNSSRNIITNSLLFTNLSNFEIDLPNWYLNNRDCFVALTSTFCNIIPSIYHRYHVSTELEFKSENYNEYIKRKNSIRSDYTSNNQIDD